MLSNFSAHKPAIIPIFPKIKEDKKVKEIAKKDKDLVLLTGDLGFGIFYYKPINSGNGLYFGVSGQKLLPQKITLGTATPEIRQHAYITAGYSYFVNKSLILKPY